MFDKIILPGHIGINFTLWLSKYQSIIYLMLTSEHNSYTDSSCSNRLKYHNRVVYILFLCLFKQPNCHFIRPQYFFFKPIKNFSDFVELIIQENICVPRKQYSKKDKLFRSQIFILREIIIIVLFHESEFLLIYKTSLDFKKSLLAFTVF